jgi:hypothetical protein
MKKMEIKKLENRYQWICKVDGCSYVRTEIMWGNDKPNSIVWYLNEDERIGENITGLNDDELEELFWKVNVKSNQPTIIPGVDESINPANFIKLGEDAFIKNVHEKLRETLSPTEKQMWINGYLLALTEQLKNK